MENSIVMQVFAFGLAQAGFLAMGELVTARRRRMIFLAAAAYLAVAFGIFYTTAP